MGRHLKLLNAHVEFLARHIRDKPEMLRLGNDVADVSHIVQFAHDAGQNMTSLNKSLAKLECALQREAGNKDNFPTDAIGSRKANILKGSVIIICMSLCVKYAFNRYVN